MSQATQAEEPGLKKVAIWIRVSTEDQARGESPEHHEHRARAYAEIKGWQVVTLYNLAGVSGKAVMAHPEARRMMEDVRARRISGLIFSKLARLARNTKELLDFAEFFKAEGADLISLEESIDTSTPSGRFFYTVVAGMAAWEREEIASRVAASVPVRAKLGKPTGGAAPFGYRWHEKQLIPDPEEAPIRRLMYELYIEHGRMLTVARLLTERGYRTRGGGKFSHTTVERLIRDPTAKGTRRANYTRSLGEGKKWVLKPAHEWVTSEVEAIVPEELWNGANALLAEKRAAGKPRTARKPVHLFAGLTFCHCGGRMWVPSNTPKYVCKACRNKVPQADLERVFQEQLKAFFLSPEQVAGALSQADQEVQAKADLLEALRREADRLKAEADEIFQLYLAKEITARTLGERHQPIEDRRVELEAEIPRLQGEIDFLRIQHLSREEVVSEAEDLYDRWEELTPHDRRAIIQAIVERVTVGKDEIEITLSCLPRPPEPPLPPPLQDDGNLCTHPQGFVHLIMGLFPDTEYPLNCRRRSFSLTLAPTACRTLPRVPRCRKRRTTSSKPAARHFSTFPLRILAVLRRVLAVSMHRPWRGRPCLTASSRRAGRAHLLPQRRLSGSWPACGAPMARVAGLAAGGRFLYTVCEDFRGRGEEGVEGDPERRQVRENSMQGRITSDGQEARTRHPGDARQRQRVRRSWVRRT
ncbi:MAG TPA: recombinase family protein [Thermoanaerobaculia bacterium]|nr:recombinase family protein [Thermoanaerobaculia bacterium]